MTARRKFLIPLALIPVLVLAILLSCPSPPDSTKTTPAARRPGTANLPNIVLILSDTTRTDHLPFHGYAKNTTPYLASLAAQGAVFENAWSVCSWTAPATATIHTSLYPWQHGVYLGMMASKKGVEKGVNPDQSINRIPEAADTLAERLAGIGYTCFGVADNVNICREEGFDQGFARLETFHHIGAEDINTVVHMWENDIKAAAPYFLYLHYNDAHAPYTARDPWYVKGSTELEDILAKYDSSISFMDDNIRRLSERLGWGPETLIVFVTDHGEEFWDHNRAGHGYALYNETMRAAFFFSHPAGGIKPLRIPNNVAPIDLFPTLMGLLGQPADPRHEGVNHSALLRGGPLPPDDRVHFAQVKRELLMNFPDPRDIVAVVQGTWKYHDHHEDGEMLFDLAADPMEKHNVIQSHPEIAARLRAAYQKSLEELERFPPEFSHLNMSEDLGRHLRDLGYVGK